jgi:hypothetical protein
VFQEKKIDLFFADWLVTFNHSTRVEGDMIQSDYVVRFTLCVDRINVLPVFVDSQLFQAMTKGTGINSQNFGRPAAAGYFSAGFF